MNPNPSLVTPLALEELPRLSPWPAILTGARPFVPRQRTHAEILREYGREKWGTVLEWLRGHEQATDADLLRLQGIHPDREIAFSVGTDFFRAPANYVFEQYQQLLLETLARYRTETLVELGSGLGDKLLRFAAELKPTQALGGEFTDSGVQCGRLLARQRSLKAAFRHLDFRKPETAALVPEGALVYTSHAIEQVPELPEAFVQALRRRRPKYVVHFEPCYEDRSFTSLVGLMRRRYTELNDYNRNLVSLLRGLQARGQIQILEHRRDVFAVSPFNSTTILVWAPCGLPEQQSESV